MLYPTACLGTDIFCFIFRQLVQAPCALAFGDCTFLSVFGNGCVSTAIAAHVSRPTYILSFRRSSSGGGRIVITLKVTSSRASYWGSRSSAEIHTRKNISMAYWHRVCLVWSVVGRRLFRIPRLRVSTIWVNAYYTQHIGPLNGVW